MVKLFASKRVLYYLLIITTLETIAVKINRVIIYLVYNLLKNTSRVGFGKDINRFNLFKLIGLHING